MAWLRIDDRVRTHPKVALAGPAAAWLWFCGICYCREHLTDGFIPKQAVSSLAMNLPSPFRHAVRLVEVRLWEDALGGYTVHDFLDWNPSRAIVLSGREAEAERKRTNRGQASESERSPAGQVSESSHVGAGDGGLGSLSGSGSLGSAEGKKQNDHGFSAFWKAYPKKVGKGDAERKFAALKPDANALTSMLEALDWQRQSRQWAKNGGEFVPNPATWLHQRRWEDEPTDSHTPLREHWGDECARLHGGSCQRQWDHDGRLQDERSKAAV